MSSASAAAEHDPPSPSDIGEVVARHWGFQSLRPLQEAAMRAVLDGRDSLVVLPTGGGKSLCYQAPAVLRGDTTVVVSPLISLMKDQVDSLTSIGISAAALNSTIPPDEAQMIVQALRDGHCNLLYVSPERLASDRFRQFLVELKVRRFAIDEAHCISHWGHDFRPEYRQLKFLKQQFPGASLHAFTATATPQVQADIVEQLGLRTAETMVGNFDRPNLTYRVVPRSDVFEQTMTVVKRHAGEAGIVYCIRRRDVDDLAVQLKAAGIDALPYHAGLTPARRKQVQTAFKKERCDLVVATVAFGMGIDRSNIRFVLHAGMPKSIEHYQQETGRAGRDGLEAECVLLYSAADAITWKRLLDKSIAEAEQEVDPNYLRSAHRHINDMDSYCRPVTCRHKSLVEYFGQAYTADSCQACDICLDDGESETVEEGPTIAKMILSCVGRVDQRFGVGHVTAVLRGENTEPVRSRGHDRLSTYGLLRDHGKNDVRDWIYQLVQQQVLVQTNDEYPILQLNEASWEVMRDERQVKLARRASKASPSKRSSADVESWEGVDRALFASLRELRKIYAEARGVPPYVVFSDATLRELARVRPSTLEAMRLVYGIGERKLSEYGDEVLAHLDAECERLGLDRDCVRQTTTATSPPRAAKPKSSGRGSAEKQNAMKLFASGCGIAEVASRTGRAASTVQQYLCEYITEQQPASVDAWIEPELYKRVSDTIDQIGGGALKPIFIALDEKVSYDQIRIVITHRRIQAGS